MNNILNRYEEMNLFDRFLNIVFALINHVNDIPRTWVQLYYYIVNKLPINPLFINYQNTYILHQL